jgi:hypothetical protein
MIMTFADSREMLRQVSDSPPDPSAIEGYREISGVAPGSDISPINALRGVDDGMTRLAEGAAIGRNSLYGGSAFSLYERKGPNRNSILSTLARCVRLGNRPAEPGPVWQQRAEIIPLEVDDIPVLPSRLIRPARGDRPADEQVWSVLTNSYFRRGNLESIEPHRQTMQAVIGAAVESQAPVHLILPTIPFKDQGPTTTGLLPGEVDLGEHAFVAQLRDMTAGFTGISLLKLLRPKKWRPTRETYSRLSRLTVSRSMCK